MIFRSGVFSRKEGLGAAEFTAHWTGVHGVLASRMPGLHGYIQNHIDRRLFERDPFPAHAIDGVSQLWFDDIAAMERAEDSPEYAACKLDIPKFQGEITILVLDSVTVSDDGSSPADHTPRAASPAKLFWFASAFSATDAATLRDRWQAQGRASLEQAGVPGLVRFVQSVVVDTAHPVSAGVPQGRLPADALGEMWFTDVAARDAFVGTNAYREIVAANPLLQPIGIYAGHEVRIV